MPAGLGLLAYRLLGLEVGADDYISKPFSPEALWALLQRWLTPRA